MHRPVLIFDFDGTVALGDGPLVAYAAAVEDAAQADGFVAAVVSELAAHREHTAVDGYDVVRVLAERAGIGADALAAGYLASRAHLGTDRAEVSAPAGLADFLAAVDAERILLTNAPDVRLAETLDVLGFAGLFDRVIADAGKPAGLEALLDDLAGAGADRILSVGDIWRNDLAPAHARGHATAMVGAFADADAEPTFRADTLDDLLVDIDQWMRAA